LFFVALRKSSKKLKWFFGIFGLIFIVAIILILFSRGAGGISIEIRGAENVKSGETVYYTVFYENKTGEDITDAEIRFFFPKNTEILDGDIVRVSTDEGWEVVKQLSIVKSGRQARESFAAKIFGLPGEEFKLKAAFITGGEEQKVRQEAKFSARVEGTPLTLNLQLSDRAQIGSEFNFNISYFNQGNFDIASSSESFFEDVPNLELRISYPEDFSFLSAEREPNRSGNVWFLPGILKNSGDSFKISGKFGGQADEEREFRAEIGVTDSEGNFIVFAQDEAKTTLVGEALTVFQTVNDARDFSVSPGEELLWQVAWRNSFQEEIDNVVVEVKLNSPALDLATVRVENGRFDSFRRTVVWDKTQNRSLETVRPTEGGTFTFRVKVKDNPPFNSAIFSEARILSRNNESLVYEDNIEIKVVSQASIAARGFYYTSYFTNTGPIPPKVGQLTTYTIIWQVFNSSNDLKDARVKAKLPSNVLWLGFSQPESEVMSYDNLSREMFWSIGELEAGTGVSKDIREVRFQIALTPEISQVNQVAGLVSQIVLEGFDSFSGLPVRAQASDITTQLPEDLKVGYTGGIVVP
jgi:hypothetical protein